MEANPSAPAPAAPATITFAEALNRARQAVYETPMIILAIIVFAPPPISLAVALPLVVQFLVQHQRMVIRHVVDKIHPNSSCAIIHVDAALGYAEDMVTLANSPQGREILQNARLFLSNGGPCFVHLRPKYDHPVGLINVNAFNLDAAFGVVDIFKNNYAVVLLVLNSERCQLLVRHLGAYPTLAGVIYNVNIVIESMDKMVGALVSNLKVKIDVYALITVEQLTQALGRGRMSVHAVFPTFTSRHNTWSFVVYFNDAHSLATALQYENRELTLDHKPATIYRWLSREAWATQAEQNRSRAAQRQRISNERTVTNF